MVPPYYETPLRNIKECTIDIDNNLEESPGNYAKSKKPIPEGICCRTLTFCYVWQNATSVLAWTSEFGDLGVRLWMKLLPLGDKSLTFRRSNPRSESSLLLQAPWPVGRVDWGSHLTCVESKGQHKSVGSALGLSEASKQRKIWLSRGLLREMGGNLNTSLLNFYIFLYAIFPIY